jgi:hypothetical protein
VTPTRSPVLRAYQSLVAQIATDEPRDGFTHVQQLPPLTNAQRTLILRANPDVTNDLEITAEGLADIFEGNVSADLYVSATVEPLLRRWLLLDVVAECEANAQLADAVDVELVSSS